MRGSGKDGSSCGGGGMCVEVTFWTFEGEDGVSKLSKCEQGVTGGGGGGLGILWKHNNLMSQGGAAINVME